MFHTLTNCFRRMLTRTRKSTRRPANRTLQVEVLEGRVVPTVVVPVLNSLPGAEATLYLDFDGHSQGSWHGYANVSTPVFDMDDDTASFSTSELAMINEVWQRVAEDFAPFNINVSTAPPTNAADFTTNKALRVAIGGSWEDWVGAEMSGASEIRSFSSSQPNVVFVFSANIVYWADHGYLDNEGHVVQTGPALATTISHESGHAFGLEHQRSFNLNHTLKQEYNPGTSTWTPIMGNNLASDRTTWHNGTTASPMVTQDDMAVLAGTANGFGYRADDHGNSIGTATALKQTPSSSAVTASGVITTTADKNYFSFATSGGQVTLEVKVAPVGANLDAKLELWRKSGGVGIPILIASADPTTALGAKINANLGSGTYYLAVGSHGTYGDVGQYTIIGTIPPLKFTTFAGGLAPSHGTDAALHLTSLEIPWLVIPTSVGHVALLTDPASMPLRDTTEMTPKSPGRAQAVDWLMAGKPTKQLEFDLLLSLEDTLISTPLLAGPARSRSSP